MLCSWAAKAPTNQRRAFTLAHINSYIGTYDSIVLDIYGGRMPETYLFACDNSRVNLHVLTYDYDIDGGAFDGGRFTGTWADHTSFAFDVLDSESYGHITVTAVPVPSSLATLIGVGVMVVGMEWWKKRRK